MRISMVSNAVAPSMAGGVSSGERLISNVRSEVVKNQSALRAIEDSFEQRVADAKNNEILKNLSDRISFGVEQLNKILQFNLEQLSIRTEERLAQLVNKNAAKAQQDKTRELILKVADKERQAILDESSMYRDIISRSVAKETEEEIRRKCKNDIANDIVKYLVEHNPET